MKFSAVFAKLNSIKSNLGNKTDDSAKVKKHEEAKFGIKQRDSSIIRL